MVIWKYVMEDSRIQVEMPKGAQVLSCQMQGPLPSIWVLVDEHKAKEIRCFAVIDTGDNFKINPQKLKFIDTIQTSDNKFVHHIFEVLP